ncbi:Uncharacterised protein [Serratia fonticola]|uniref:Uncharacterized protein n=1 Tax=Serratia fonticola TaxID=47917 RepID=A0A4U9WP62_SERFO|nr:Uncharacterised protein [Serratia fonticola]
MVLLLPKPGNTTSLEGIIMKYSKIFSLLLLAGLSSTVHAESTLIKGKTPSAESRPIFAGDKIRIIKENGETVETVVELSDDSVGIIRLPKDERSYFHGNWLAEYKIEHFRNEGRSTNSRPVHEIVFADGRVNFGDTGWNTGFVLKQVHFTNDSRNDSQHKVDFRMIEMEIRPAWAKSIDKHWFMLEGIYLVKPAMRRTVPPAATTILAVMVMASAHTTVIRYRTTSASTRY